MAPKAPTTQLIKRIILIKLFLVIIIRVMGATFCQVRIIIICIHLVVWITWGNQKWKGAAPILIDRAKVVNKLGKNIEFSEFKEKNIAEEKIIKTDAIAWAIKYLIAVSEERGFNWEIIIGISLIKLISNPIQQVNHEEEEQAKRVPIINEKT